MERYVFPRIGRQPVSEVDTADVLEILTSIRHVKAATAREVRQRIWSVLEWAVAMDLRNRQPCDRVRPALVHKCGLSWRQRPSATTTRAESFGRRTT